MVNFRSSQKGPQWANFSACMWDQGCGKGYIHVGDTCGIVKMSTAEVLLQQDPAFNPFHLGGIERWVPTFHRHISQEEGRQHLKYHHLLAAHTHCQGFELPVPPFHQERACPLPIILIRVMVLEKVTNHFGECMLGRLPDWILLLQRWSWLINN